jgi:hypothetical protein
MSTDMVKYFMGNLKTFFVATVLLLTGSALMAGPSEDHKGIFSNRGNDLVVIKTAKDMVGAKVEVFSSAGDLVTAQITQKRKMFIDFADVTLGTYTIKITKGDKVKEMSFNKK